MTKYQVMYYKSRKENDEIVFSLVGKTVFSYYINTVEHVSIETKAFLHAPNSQCKGADKLVIHKL